VSVFCDGLTQDFIISIPRTTLQNCWEELAAVTGADTPLDLQGKPVVTGGVRIHCITKLHYNMLMFCTRFLYLVLKARCMRSRTLTVSSRHSSSSCLWFRL